MNRFLLAFAFVFIIQSVFAQQAKQLVFREETFDFGTVAENKGPVTHEFVFTNSGTRPVKVLGVQASCGCTTPGWSKDVVAPGKTGYIQASFDPKGRPGYFSKSLTVTTDLDANPIVLQIKGQVSGDTENFVDATGFTIANGSLKFKNSSFNMGKVFMKDEYAVKEFQVLNDGAKPVTFKEKITGPNHIKAEVKPATIPAGGKATIKVSYNGKLKNQYGFQSDNIEFTTDDAENPVKSFSVFATIEDYFPQLSADELKKAPQLQLSQGSLDLGRVNPKTSVLREVNFTNTGKTELLVKAVQGNCACIKAFTSKSKLKPGESATVKIEFTPQDRSGTQQKAVTIYSNDPRNPVQRFTFSAYIE
jgi:hypothetical protein